MRDPPQDPGPEEPRSAVGARIDPSTHEQGAREQPHAPRDPSSKPRGYAGFWRRFAAYLVDSILLGLPTVLVLETLGLPTPDVQELMAAPLRDLVVVVTTVYVLQWPYFAGFEASGWQATPGKRLLSVRVTDEQGQRLTFARASARYFGKILSEALFAIGYLMIAVTEKKQGLHDMLADCLVVKD